MAYDVGKADGVLGKQTNLAIRTFELDRNLPSRGRVTDTLIEELSNALAEGFQRPAS